MKFLDSGENLGHVVASLACVGGRRRLTPRRQLAGGGQDCRG